MELLGKLVQTGTCSAEGSVAARNPISNLMSSMIESGGRDLSSQSNTNHAHPLEMEHARRIQMQMQNGMERNAKGMNVQPLHHPNNMPPAVQDHHHHHHIREYMMHFQNDGQQAAADQWANEFAPQVTSTSMMEQAFMESRNTSMMEHAFMESRSNGWVNEFMPQNHHHPPPPPITQSRFEVLDEAWQDSNHNLHEAAWRQSERIEEKGQIRSSLPSEETRRATAEMMHTMTSNPDPRWQNSEFLKFISNVHDGSIAIGDESQSSALEGAWNDINEKSDLEVSWAAAAGTDSRFESAWQENSELGMNEADLEAVWERALLHNETPFEEVWKAEGLNEEEEVALTDYQYTKDNEYLSNSDAFEEGISLFKKGDIKQAIMAFEAVVQQQPENSEGWRLLGECHAENDEDKKAITCFERSVEHDPYNLPALLSLGVSYVNELNPQRALVNLKSWIKHNPKFLGFEIELDDYSDGSLMDEVMQLMLKADSYDQDDPDVKVVLGVLYNVSRDFDAAVIAFRKGVDAAPDNYSVWNKLGATLANSSRSSEAIPSYHRALELKPKYARGWLNLGISHANLGNYFEAARAYLQALSLNPDASHIWSYLRIAFTCLDRFDLVKQTDFQDLDAFSQEFQLIQL